MCFSGTFADYQAGRNLPIIFPLSHERSHLTFAGREATILAAGICLLGERLFWGKSGQSGV